MPYEFFGNPNFCELLVIENVPSLLSLKIKYILS